MFRFENEFFLYALILIPILVSGYIYVHIKRKKQLAQYGDLPLLEKLMPQWSSKMKHLRFSILMLALASLLLAAANPQVGSSMEKGTRKGVDIMVCMDISNSMLAEDISPNRLDAAKMAMSHFIDKLQGDRIGLVVFAGKAFVQLPITTDYAAAKMFINYISPNLINEQGTDIANALDLAAVSMLPGSESSKDNKDVTKLTSKVILVVSDGEDHFQEAVDMAHEVSKLGITIHTIGIGSTKGEPIPVHNGTGFKTDNEGNTVMTRLNEGILRDIATAGKGVYVHASNANMGFDEIAKKIDSMNKVDLADISFARYDSKFQYPLLVGLLLLLIEAFMFTTKSKFKNWINHFQQSFKGKNTVILLLIFILGGANLQAQTRDELSAIRKGNDNFKTAEKLRNEAIELQKKGGEINSHNAAEKMKKAAEGYQNAEINYRKAMEKTKNYDKANYNLGTALYRQNKFADAEESFRFVSQQEKTSKDLKAKAFHNLGNSLLKQQKYQDAIDAYKHALKMDPKNMNTKYNLEYARKKMIAQQQQQKQQNKDKNQNQQKQDQKQGDGNNDQNQNKGQNQPQQGNKDQQQNQNQNQNQKQQQQIGSDKQKQQENKRQLDALQQNERQLQQKVQQQQQQGSKHHQEKDW